MSWPKPQLYMQSKTEGPSPVPFDYVKKHKEMSSKTIDLELFWQKKRQLAFKVNAHVFNPTESIVGHKLIELILSEKIKVADKTVIDLGCGCGVVGLCAIVKKAKKVLFTDINSHIDGIQNHPLFRKCDEWQVQNVLADVQDSSYDMVLVLPPGMVVKEGKQVASDTFETGIFRPSTLYAQILADSGRVLKPGGQLVIWLRFPLASFQSFIEFITLAAEKFDIKSASMLADGLESLICSDHEKSMMSRWMYKFQKGGVSNDAIWMMLSLNKS
ncbi:MAG: methyltransferase [Nitrospirota bacterium]